MHLPPDDSDPGFAWLLELELPPESLLPFRHRGQPQRQDAIARAPEGDDFYHFIIDYQMSEGGTNKSKLTFESPLPLLDPYRTDSDPAGCQPAIEECS